MASKKKTNSRFVDPNMPTLDINERFVEACATGDYQTVNIILESIKDFNIDVTDNLGRTALRLAVANENIEVVQALLAKSDSPRMREALLLAIYMGHTQIAESILRHPQYKIFNEKKFLNGATDSFWQTPSSDDAQFSPDITPIMLASQYNRTEIVQMLLLNGDRIEKPHDFHCKCNECGNRFKFDSLRHAQSRLNAYRGLASESYISLASIDPILTAFELAFELRILSDKEKYFKSEYLSLAEKLSEFTVKLLSNVRGRDELEIVLNKNGKENEEKFELLSRFDLAIKYQEMPFVAHPNCQQKLVEIWFTGIRKITKMNQFLSLLLYFCIVISIPFCAFSYIIAPKSKIGRFMCQPCIKFIAFLSSYIVLVGLIVISSLQFSDEEMHRDRFSNLFPAYRENFSKYTSNEKLHYRFEIEDFFIRSNNPSQLDVIISIWLFGLIINEFKQIYFYGIKDYLFSWGNILNAFMFTLFVVSYGLKYYTMILVTIERNNLEDSNFWYTLGNLEEEHLDDQKEMFKTFYWLNDDRFFWFTFDPINLSEGLFAIATTLSFSKICFFLPASQTLGPLQITLGRMISDILKFIFIFVIIFLGFLFGLNNLYWYYQPEVRRLVEIESHYNPELGNTTNVNANLFLEGNPEAVLLQPFKNQLTLVFGYVIFAIFHIANITVLLNMLIAMMTRSYETILHHSDTEWKFSRSKLYMEFIRDGVTLPVPFNIIPMPSACVHAFKKIFFCLFKNSNAKRSQTNDIEMPQFKQNGNAKSKMNGAANGVSSEKRRSFGDVDRLTYKKVMERVVKRFILHNNRENEDIRESDFDELKQDVQMVRVEMLTDLKRAREDTLKYVSLMHNGLSLIGEFLFQSEDSSDLIRDFRHFQLYEKQFNDEMDVYIHGYNAMRPTTPVKPVKHITFKILNDEAKTSPSQNSPNMHFQSNSSPNISIDSAKSSEEKIKENGHFPFTDLNAITEEN